MIKVYGSPNTRAMRVLWLLEELNVPAELHPIDPRKGEHHQPDYWRVNPFGKVPSIAVDGYTLAESAAICPWLADQHPDQDLIPKPGSKARGTHDQWLLFAMTELEAHLWLAIKNKLLLPEPQRVPDIIPQALGSFSASCTIFAAHMQGRSYVLGDKFQVIDIFMTSLLSWALSMEAPGVDAGLRAYLGRMKERPAFLRFQEKYGKPKY